MARYQLRTPDYLEDIITRMADHGWLTLRTWSVLVSDDTEKDYDNFRAAIRDSLTARVRTYALCGLSNICSEHLQSTSWSPASHALDANPNDRVYHVFPLRTLDDLLAEITSKSITSIKNLIKAEHEDEACTMLSAVLKLVLSNYLYIDPVCGKAELCVYSSSSPEAIWQKRDARGELLEEGA